MASLGVPVSEQTIPLTADDEAAIVDAVVSVLLETKPALWEANGQTVASAADLAVERLTGGITNARTDRVHRKMRRGQGGWEDENLCVL